MFIGKTFAGTPPGLVSAPPPASNVGTLTVQNAIFDELYATVDVIDLNSFNGELPAIWTFETRLHANFNGNLYGGNVSFSEQIVEAVRIKKRTGKDKNFQTIYEKEILSNEDFKIQLMDYFEPCGKVDYMYVAVISGGENQAVVNSVMSKFESYFLCEKGTSYPMILDTAFTKQLNQRVNTVETWGRKYPVIVKNGNLGYYTGSVECTFIEETDDSREWDVDTAWDYRNIIYDFLTNGQPKILKDYEGNIYMVAVTGDAITETTDHPQHVKTKFDVTECGDAYYVGDLYDNNFIDLDIDR